MKIKQVLGLWIIRTKLNLLAVVNMRKAGEAAFKIFCTPFPPTINKKKTIFDTGKPLEFTVNNTLIKGYVLNEAGSRKAFIAHGFSSSSKNFHNYVTGLVKNNFEVYAFDAPAHGMSAGSQVNALDYAQMIKMASSLFGPFDAYLAHSFGGLAVSLALEEIVHSPASRLVLIAPATETETAINDAFLQLGIKNDRIKIALKQEILNVSGQEAEWFSIRRCMKNITASTLWVHDKDDRTTPLTDALQVKADGYPNIRFMITAGLGHRQIYRDEKVKQSVIDFLSGTKKADNRRKILIFQF